MTGTATARRRLMLGLCAVASSPGCNTVLNRDAPRTEYFSIDDLRAQAAPPAGAQSLSGGGSADADAGRKVLMLAAGTTPTLFDSERMVFTRDGVSRAYYHYANWSERPGRRMARMAESRLAQDPYWKAVVSTVAGVRGDLLLTLSLEDLTHDDSSAPGQVNVACTAELLDWRQHRFIARTRLRRSVAVNSRDAKGAATAASQAVSLLLDDLTAWTRQTARGPAP